MVGVAYGYDRFVAGQQGILSAVPIKILEVLAQALGVIASGIAVDDIFDEFDAGRDTCLRFVNGQAPGGGRQRVIGDNDVFGGYVRGYRG